MWVIHAADRGPEARPRLFFALTDGRQDALFSAHTWGQAVGKIRRIMKRRKIESIYAAHGSLVTEHLPYLVRSLHRYVAQMGRAEWLLLVMAREAAEPGFPTYASRADRRFARLRTDGEGPGRTEETANPRDTPRSTYEMFREQLETGHA